ncbi:MAG TPA: hypothetical protein VG165_13115 [Solirubrobacteraceae bacterium]|nr:hypothetical protein [Solirubrobacteraceae bacterium]
MSRDEAERDCAERNAVPGAQPGVHWLAREFSPGEWSAVRVVIPGLTGRGAIGPLKTTTESGPRPEQPPDPRPVHNPLWGTW